MNLVDWKPDIEWIYSSRESRAIGLANNSVYIGGYINTVNGQPRGNFARIGFDGVLK